MTADEIRAQAIARADYIVLTRGIVQHLIEFDGKCPVDFARQANRLAEKGKLL